MCVDLTVALLLLVDLSVTLVAGGVTVGVFRRTERATASTRWAAWSPSRWRSC